MPVTFGYTCQECGEGTVRATTIEEYETRVHGMAFTVKDAVVGVCDNCGAKDYDMTEVERWEREYEKAQYLQPDEITRIRESLDLSKEKLARLIGCTRQSIYAWEQPDRERAQSRMADLLLKLVAEGAKQRRVDVVGFLRDEARMLGDNIGTVTPEPPARFCFTAEEQPYSMHESHSQYRLISSDGEQRVVLTDEKDEIVGSLSYDYTTAVLELRLNRQLPLRRADVLVRFKDGTSREEKGVYVTPRTKLLTDCSYPEDQVRAVVLVAAE